MNKEQFYRERHWQTQALVDAFVALKENEVVPYKDLAVLCKIDEKSVRNRVQSAKKIARNQHNVAIEVVRGVGVTRLSQDLVTAPVAKAITRARSAFRTGHQLIRRCITDFASLPAETKSTVYMQQAVIGAGLLVTDRSSKRILKEHAETSNGVINVGRTLELLK